MLELDDTAAYQNQNIITQEFLSNNEIEILSEDELEYLLKRKVIQHEKGLKRKTNYYLFIKRRLQSAASFLYSFRLCNACVRHERKCRSGYLYQ